MLKLERKVKQYVAGGELKLGSRLLAVFGFRPRTDSLTAERAICVAMFRDAYRRRDGRGINAAEARLRQATNAQLAAEISHRAPASWRGR